MSVSSVIKIIDTGFDVNAQLQTSLSVAVLLLMIKWHHNIVKFH